MRRLTRNAMLIALAGATAFAGWQLLRGRGAAVEAFEPPAPAVRAATVERREIADRVEALGTTSSWESIELRPTVTEFVSAIHFTDGQAVTRGDALVTLAQQEESAQLDEARAYLDEQLREVRRIEGLVARKSLPQSQLDERRTLRDIALARVSAAQAALADRTIRAPFTGLLGLRNVSPGALVTPETVITTLDDVATLRLDFTVPSALLSRLRTGEAVTAASPAFEGREFSATVTGIDSRVNPVDRSLTVRARIDNADLALRPGMLLTLALGAYASSGAIALALAAAVVATVLLNLKPTLHGWLRQIKHRELTAALQLLVLSVVILPYLPNAGFGPYAALNPYALWWAVILIAGLSLAGHFAVRIAGPRRGLLWTGMLGGLASSTAATLALARRARQQPALADAAAMGTLAASAMMFLRMAVLLGAIHPPLLRTYGAALVFTGAAMAGLSLWQWRHLAVPPPDSDEGVAQIPPFDLSTALGFGAFLAAMAVLMPAARDWLGHGGLYGLAAVSGLADVDATAISIARLQAADGLPVAAAVTALGLVTLTNMITKATIAWVTGGARLGRAVASGYALCMLAGALVLALLVMAG